MMPKADFRCFYDTTLSIGILAGRFGTHRNPYLKVSMVFNLDVQLRIGHSEAFSR